MITPEEYQNYRANAMSLDDQKLSEEDKNLIATEFKLMDQNGDGILDWWEFLNHESKMYLATRTKVSTGFCEFGI